MFKFHNWNSRILMDKAGGEGGSGGGGNGNAGGGANGGGAGAGGSNGGQGGSSQGGSGGSGGILFDDNNSGGNGQGGEGDKGGAGGNGNAGGSGGNNNNGGGQNSQTPTIPDNWKDALPDDLKNHAALGNLKDVASVVKSLIHAQSMVGAEKIVIPKKGDAAELRGVFEKLGLPKTDAEYKFDIAGKVLDKDFLEAYRKTCFEKGILPEQAKAMADWFDEINEKARKAQVEAYDRNVAVEMGKLKGEWGDAFNENVAQAKAGLRDLPKESQDFIRNHGLGNNPHIIKLLQKYGSTLSEDKVRGEGGTLSLIHI